MRSVHRWATLVCVMGLCVMGLAGCQDELPPPGQILLYVNTDAPLPAPGGQPSTGLTDGPQPLFDRLRIEIFEPGASQPCAHCSREFGIDARLVGEGKASVGIAPTPGQEGVRVRVRLYRSAGTASGEPRPPSTLEAVVRLPATGPEGKREVTVTLWTDDVAKPMGSLEAPITPDDGPPQPGLVGSWWGAEVVDCDGPAQPGEICVPGGAFWMGDPRLDLSAVFDMEGESERLVVLSPFYLDATEVSVAAFRPSGLAYSLAPGGPSDNPHEAGTNIPHCTYSSDPGPFESHPVVCITWQLAQQFCALLGRSLPSEAQLEYVATGLGSRPFVWGADEPQCVDAVWGRESVSDTCGAAGVGTRPVGSGARDRLPLADGEILDLAGNATEWAADQWNRDTEPCWGPGLFVDPLCDNPSAIDPAGRSLRGGDWRADPLGLRGALRKRLANETHAVSAALGLRCARPGR